MSGDVGGGLVPSAPSSDVNQLDSSGSSSSASRTNYSSVNAYNETKRDYSKPEKNTLNVNVSTINHRASPYTYEELSDGLTCPTCQGTGKIPRGQEDDLVALIPYKDKRLKPQRTWIYVLLCFVICVIIAAMLCAFLIPRSVIFVNSNVTALHVDLDLNSSVQSCFMVVQSTYNVTNDNFVLVRLNTVQIEVTVTFYEKIVLTQVFDINQSINIRSTEQYLKDVNFTLHNDAFPVPYCSPSSLHNTDIFMEFQSTFNYTVMEKSSLQIASGYFRVNCNPEKEHILQAVDYMDTRRNALYL